MDGALRRTALMAESVRCGLSSLQNNRLKGDEISQAHAASYSRQEKGGGYEFRARMIKLSLRSRAGIPSG